MKVREEDTQLHQGAGGSAQPFGRTTRYYKFTATGDDFSIKMPAGTKFAAITRSAENLHVQFGASAAVVTTAAAKAKFAPVDAGDKEPLRPIEPGEYINISHADGSTAIGVFYLILEGKNLPEDVAEIVTSDPG